MFKVDRKNSMFKENVRVAVFAVSFILRVYLYVVWDYLYVPTVNQRKSLYNLQGLLLFINIAPAQFHEFMCQKIKCAQLHQEGKRNKQTRLLVSVRVPFCRLHANE